MMSGPIQPTNSYASNATGVPEEDFYSILQRSGIAEMIGQTQTAGDAERVSGSDPQVIATSSMVAPTANPSMAERLREFFRQTTGGTAWLATRSIGTEEFGCALTVAFVSPYKPFTNTNNAINTVLDSANEGAVLAGPVLIAAGLAADFAPVDPKNGTFFFSFAFTGALGEKFPYPIIVTYRPSDGRFELGTKVFDTIKGPMIGGAPAAMLITNARLGLDFKENINASVAAGALMRNPVAEGALGILSGALGLLADRLGPLSTKLLATANPVGLALGTAGSLISTIAKTGQFLTQDWKIFQGMLVLSGNLVLNYKSFLDSYVQVNNQRISFDDLGQLIKIGAIKFLEGIVGIMSETVRPASAAEPGNFNTVASPASPYAPTSRPNNDLEAMFYIFSKQFAGSNDAFPYVYSAMIEFTNDVVRTRGAGKLVTNKAVSEWLFGVLSGKVPSDRQALVDKIYDSILDSYLINSPAAAIPSIKKSMLSRFNSDVKKGNISEASFKNFVTFLKNLSSNPGTQESTFGSRVADDIVGGALYARIFDYYRKTYLAEGKSSGISDKTTYQALSDFSNQFVVDYVKYTRDQKIPPSIAGFEGFFATALENPGLMTLISGNANQSQIVRYVKSIATGDNVKDYAKAQAVILTYQNAVQTGTLATNLRGYVWVKDLAGGGSPRTLGEIQALADRIESEVTKSIRESRRLAGLDQPTLIASANGGGIQSTDLDTVTDNFPLDALVDDFQIISDLERAEIEEYLIADDPENTPLITVGAIDDTPSLLVASAIFGDAYRNDGLTGDAATAAAGRIYDALPDWAKLALNNELTSFDKVRDGSGKEPASQDQRVAFQNAYLLDFDTGKNRTSAYSAGKMASEALDKPVVFNDPLGSILANAAAPQTRVAGLAAAFTSLGTPVYTLSGADAANFEVESGTLFIKAGTVVDPALQQKFAVKVSVIYPNAGEKPVNWIGTWPPTGSSDFSTKLAWRAALPPIDGAPKNEIAPAGWYIAANTPDIIAGNGAWPGEGSRHVIYDISSGSPSGGSMAFLLTGFTEIIATDLTGLIVGQNYQLSPIYWQQSSIDGLFLGNSSASLLVTVGTEKFTFGPKGSVAGDDWQSAIVTFTATATTMAVKVEGELLNPGNPGAIVVDVGPATGNRAPASITTSVKTPIISNSADTLNPLLISAFSVNDDGLGQNTVSLSGEDAGLFDIRENKLFLKAGVDLAAVRASGRTYLTVAISAEDLSASGVQKITQEIVVRFVENLAPTSVKLVDSSNQLLANLEPALSINENSVIYNERLIANVEITDDRQGRNNITLSGSDADMFEIRYKAGSIGSDALLYLKPGVKLDFEKNPVLDVTVTVTDPDFPASPVSRSLAVKINDVNEAPTDLTAIFKASFVTMASDLTVRTKVADLTVVDDALGTNTLTLAGTDANMFEVVNGQMFLKAGLPLSRATKPFLAVNVEVKDQGLSTPAISKAFRFEVRDINVAPTAVVIEPTITAIDENTVVESPVEVATFNVRDDGLGTNTLSLSGADAAFFEIVGDRLFLKAGVNLNYETNPTLSVTVNADDTSRGTELDASATYTLQLRDLNEAPTDVTFANIITVTSNSTPLAAPMLVADIVVADDALGANTYQLVGGDADKFEIKAGKLYLKAGIILDYLTKPVFDVSIFVRDTNVIGSDLARGIFRINVAPIAGFDSVYGKFIYDVNGTGETYIQWPDGNKQIVILSQSTFTGEMILTDALTNRRLAYITAPDGEYYIKPTAVTSPSAAMVAWS